MHFLSSTSSRILQAGLHNLYWKVEVFDRLLAGTRGLAIKVSAIHARICSVKFVETELKSYVRNCLFLLADFKGLKLAGK